jgi:site-specific recombinase XerD
MPERTMNRLLMSYLERLPGAMQEVELCSGEKVKQCLYSPHSLRATTATLLLESGVAIEFVQDLLDHKHITGERLRLPQDADLKEFWRAFNANYR